VICAGKLTRLRVEQLELSGLGVPCSMVQYPAPAIGGPIFEFPIFDLITENRCQERIRLEQFTDLIDQAIGLLKEVLETELPRDFQKETEFEVVHGFVFIAMAMSSDDANLEDVHGAIKEVAGNLGLVAERVDEPPSNERITDRVLESLQKAEFVVADLEAIAKVY
jgi:hypothetical protein